MARRPVLHTLPLIWSLLASPQLANVSRVVLAYTLPLSYAFDWGAVTTHNVVGTSSFLSLSLPLSRCLLSPPFRVYSAIVSRTGDQSANSRPQPHEQRGPHGRRRLLVSNNHSSEKMGAQTETTMRAESPIRQRRRLAFFVI